MLQSIFSAKLFAFPLLLIGTGGALLTSQAVQFPDTQEEEGEYEEVTTTEPLKEASVDVTALQEQLHVLQERIENTESSLSVLQEEYEESRYIIFLQEHTEHEDHTLSDKEHVEDILSCAEHGPSFAPEKQIIFNEIAWMGTTGSTSHEWIELRNLKEREISLAGWHLKSASGNISFSFQEGDHIPSQGFFLLADSVTNFPSLDPHATYTGMRAPRYCFCESSVGRGRQ
jgi:hypothetical protein